MHFQGINITFTEYSWKGLEYGNKDSLLDGSVDTGTWFYAIGAINPFGAGLPGPTGEISIVELYVNCQGKKENYIKVIHFLF